MAPHHGENGAEQSPDRFEGLADTLRNAMFLEYRQQLADGRSIEHLTEQGLEAEGIRMIEKAIRRAYQDDQERAEEIITRVRAEVLETLRSEAG